MKCVSEFQGKEDKLLKTSASKQLENMSNTTN